MACRVDLRKSAVGLQPDVMLIDRSVARLRWLSEHFPGHVNVLMANVEAVVDAVKVIALPVSAQPQRS